MVTQRDEIFNPEKEKPFSFTCKECFNGGLGFLKLYPEIILESADDLSDKHKKIDPETKAAVVEREALISQFLKKMSVLQMMKKITREQIESKEDLQASKVSDDKTQLDTDNQPQEEKPASQEVHNPEVMLGKRKMLADSELFDEEDKSVCMLAARRAVLNQHAEFLQSDIGVLMREDMYEFLCKCDDCLELYLTVDPGLGLLTDAYFEDENYKEALHQTNEEPLEEITPENADSEFMSYMAGKFKERLGRDITQFETMVMSEKYGKLKDRLGTLIMQSGKTEITEQDMRSFLTVLQSEASGAERFGSDGPHYHD